MALTSTLYRFRIDLSDIDRGVYDALDLRVAMHPSESIPFLLTRVIAFALNHQDGLKFAPGGLSDTEEPALSVNGPNGIELWIEIGNPAARRLHKASKSSRAVRVYTYKDPELLIREIASEKVHRAEEIGIFALSSAFLDELASTLERDNTWTLVMNEGSLLVTAGERAIEGELRALSCSARPR